MFVANFVVQLDNFWTAGKYFNKLYFINACVKVCLTLVSSFCRLNICCLILSLAQTQNLKLISFFCRSPVSANRTSNSVFYKWDVKVFWSQKSGWEDMKGSHFLLRKRKSSYEGKGSLLTKDLVTWFPKWYWCFLWQRQENNKLVGSLDSTRQLWVLLERHAICQTSMPKSAVQTTKYIGHNFTKVTTFIIIIIKK